MKIKLKNSILGVEQTSLSKIKMTFKVKKSTFFLGLGIFLLWIEESLYHKIINFSTWALPITALLGIVFWREQIKNQKEKEHSISSQLTLSDLSQAISDTKQIISCVIEEDPSQNISNLKIQLQNLEDNPESSSFSVGIIGKKNIGKTSLKKLLNQEKYSDILEKDILTNIHFDVDIIIFLVNENLTYSELEKIKLLHQMHCPCLIAFNKQDQYDDEDRQAIIEKIQQQVQSIIHPSDVIGINSISAKIKNRQYNFDGSSREWIEKEPPNITSLLHRLKIIETKNRRQLFIGTNWRRVINIKQQVKTISNNIRYNKAIPIIKKYELITATVVSVNPIPSLDFLATAAINTQMIVDLSKIYKQGFTFSQGQVAAIAIGKILLQLGIAELSIHTISSLLKSNVITYVLGSLSQGISVAYLTHIVGLSLIEYFQEQENTFINCSKIDIAKFSQIINKIFAKTQQEDLLRTFVKETSSKISTIPNMI